VSRITVRRALNELRAEGLVTAGRGRGWQVTGIQAGPPIGLFRVTSRQGPDSVPLSIEVLIHGELVHSVCCWNATRQDPDSVDVGQEASRRRNDDEVAGVPWGQRREERDDHATDGRHLGQPGYPLERSWVGVKDRNVPGQGAFPKPVQRTRGASCSGQRSEHHGPDEPEEEGDPDNGLPVPAEVGQRSVANRPHQLARTPKQSRMS